MQALTLNAKAARAQSSNMKWIFPVLLTLFMMVFRFAGIEYPALLNVTPVFALILCFKDSLRGQVHIPLIGYIISDIVLNAYYGVTTSIGHLMFMTACLLGVYLVGNIQKLGLLSKTFISTTAFFVLTSTLAWLSNPFYEKSLAGWASAIVFGMPQYPPAYLFYMNSLIGNYGFAWLFEKAIVHNSALLTKKSTIT